MALWNDDLLNTATGELDMSYIREAARNRAAAVYGTQDLAPCEIRESQLFIEERAHIFRIRIRAKLGLPDDREMVAMPADLVRMSTVDRVRREA